MNRMLESLRSQVDELVAEAGEFPAIHANSRRVKACLRMMEMDLGRVPFKPKGNE
jgi:hypothetical protein